MQHSFFLLASAGMTAAASLASVVLDRHNTARALHGSPALRWSDELAGIAQGHTNMCQFEHKVDGPYGQNLAMMSWTPGFPAPDAVTTAGDMVTGSWYSEVAIFNQYGEENVDMTNFENWGHFTQVVWKSTFEVGCAMALCEAGSAYILECDYRMPGNIGGQYADNVPRPL